MKPRNIVITLVCAISSISLHQASAQEIAFKTNIINDALLSPNIGIELTVAPKWSIETIGEVNAWTLSHNRKWKHWFVQPEARYWLCDALQGHFLAVNAVGGQYNMGGFNGHLNLFGTDWRKLRDSRYQGWFVGAGIAYGYAFPISTHFNLEAEIGIGWAYTRYDRFRCSGCGVKIAEKQPHNYFGPNKTAINLTYVF